jgi:hypothetical protein
MRSFKFARWAQRFFSAHSAVYNTINLQRHLSRRTLRLFTTMAANQWQSAIAAA